MGRIAERIRALTVTCERCGRTIPLAEKVTHQAHRCVHVSWDYRLPERYLDQPRHLRAS